MHFPCLVGNLPPLLKHLPLLLLILALSLRWSLTPLLLLSPCFMFVGGPVVQFSRFYLHFSPRAFSASLLALRAVCSSLPLFSPPVFRTCILEFFGLFFSRFLSFSPRVFWRSRLFFGLLSSRFSDFSPRVFWTSLLAFCGLLSSCVFLPLLAFTCVWVPETSSSDYVTFTCISLRV